MTKTEIDMLEIQRRLNKIEANNRQLLETNDSLVKNVKYLMELNKPKEKTNEG